MVLSPICKVVARETFKQLGSMNYFDAIIIWKSIVTGGNKLAPIKYSSVDSIQSIEKNHIYIIWEEW